MNYYVPRHPHMTPSNQALFEALQRDVAINAKVLVTSTPHFRGEPLSDIDTPAFPHIGEYWVVGSYDSDDNTIMIINPTTNRGYYVDPECVAPHDPVDLTDLDAVQAFLGATS